MLTHRDVWSDHRREGAPSRHGVTNGRLAPAIEQISVSRTMGRPSSEVADALRLRPDHLMTLAFPGAAPRGDGRVDVILRSQSWPRRLRIPARIEFRTPVSGHSNAVIGLRWCARRHVSLFPVMEAEISVRPTTSPSSEMILVGEYRPPLGLIGLLMDRLIGARLAISTAQAFLQDVAKAISSDSIVRGQRIQSEGVESPIRRSNGDSTPGSDAR